MPTLARRAGLSQRTFARRFHAATGTTSHAWITAQRLARAQVLLEQTTLPIHQIAVQAGFGSYGRLREHLTAAHGLSPRQYRHHYRTRR